jgi:glycosyltransferase involved in cell wall biosynthesis
LKIALVTETFPPEVNGVAMTLGVIAREFGLRQHEVTVYRPHYPKAADGGAPPPPFTEVGMPGMPIPGYPMLRLGFPAQGSLRRRWKADRPDLVHVVTEGPLGSSAISAARRLKIPVTSSYHTQFHAYTGHYGIGLMKSVTLAWLRRVHNRTDRTFAPTAELCAELTELGFRGMEVLSRGVDTRHFHPSNRSEELRRSWGAGPDDPVVLHAGRFAREKNYPLLLEAWTAMSRVQPRLRFVLVGDGPLRSRLQHDFPQASFAGFMDRETLGRYYASADLYVHCSLTETFGNVLTEAMASGLAPATFDYAAGRLFVRDGVNGLVAPCDRPDRLIAAATRLATDGALRRRLGAAAAETMAAQSWQKVIVRFEQSLQAVIEEGRARPPGALALTALRSRTR